MDNKRILVGGLTAAYRLAVLGTLIYGIQVVRTIRDNADDTKRVWVENKGFEVSDVSQGATQRVSVMNWPDRYPVYGEVTIPTEVKISDNLDPVRVVVENLPKEYRVAGSVSVTNETLLRGESAINVTVANWPDRQHVLVVDEEAEKQEWRMQIWFLQQEILALPAPDGWTPPQWWVVGLEPAPPYNSKDQFQKFAQTIQSTYTPEGVMKYREYKLEVLSATSSKQPHPAWQPKREWFRSPPKTE